MHLKLIQKLGKYVRKKDLFLDLIEYLISMLNYSITFLDGPWVVFNSFNAPNSVAPVGLSIDENGNLVVGEYRGGRLHFIDPW